MASTRIQECWEDVGFFVYFDKSWETIAVGQNRVGEGSYSLENQDVASFGSYIGSRKSDGHVR